MNTPDSSQTALTQFDALIKELDELAKISLPLKKTDCVRKLRQLTPQLADLCERQPTANPKRLGIQPLCTELIPLIDDVKEKILLATSPRQEQISDTNLTRAICTPEYCGGTTQEEVDDILIAAAAVDLAVAIAQGIAAAIPQEIAGEANPVYIAAIVVATAIAAVQKGLALDAAILQKAAHETADCQQAAFQRVVYSMCDTLNQIKDSLDKLHIKIDLIDQKINILINQVAELIALTTEILLREIEEDLANCKKLTSLYLPITVDGRLETIQSLIEDLVNASITAGLSTGSAASYLKQGLDDAAKKEYCKALEWFSMAYNELTIIACRDTCSQRPPKISNCKA